MQGALNIGSTSNYAIYNIHFNNIEIYDSRYNAIYVRAAANKPLSNISLKNITVNTTPNYGIYFAGVNGTMSYCNLLFTNVQRNMNAIPSSLSWTQADDCRPTLPLAMDSATEKPAEQGHKFIHEGKLFISVNGHIYDSYGRLIHY